LQRLRCFAPKKPGPAFTRYPVRMTTLPPDRGHIDTEHRHPGSLDFDALDVSACVALLTNDHAEVISAVRNAQPALSSFIEALVPRIGSGGRLVYLGAGTSGRLGVLDASECPPTFQTDPDQVIGLIAGGDAALRRSSESKEDDPKGAASDFEQINLQAHDTVLGIAAGGTTPYVLGGLRLAKTRNTMTGLLTCANTNSDANEAGCDHLIVLNTGPEVLAGSTRLKAGSATKLALNIITTTLFTQLGKVYSNLMVDLRATNNKLKDRAIRILREVCPHLSRTEAAETIEQAQGDLKCAIVMQRLHITFNEATQRLQAHHGHIRPILHET